MRLEVRVDKMDDRRASTRASTTEQACPANALAFDQAISISAQTWVTGVAVQVDLARRSHHLIGDLLKAGLQFPGNRAQSSHLDDDICLGAV
eukprot:2506693-Pyramimonas_sp.AAC.1